MTTALDIITDAHKMIGVLAEGESLTAEQSVDGLNALNGMVAAWEFDGIAIGAPAWTLTTTIPLPDNHLDPLRYNLAVRIAPSYTTPVSELVMRGAETGLGNLHKAYGMPMPMTVDSALLKRRGLRAF